MKKEIADVWVQALRSGEYEQGKHSLNEKGKFCCLGVLCEIALKDNVVEKKVFTFLDDDDSIEETVRYDGSSAFLPERVQDWAGMKSDSGLYDYNQPSLTQMNDSDFEFDVIADFIEENYERL
jgi:hypothetical protein